MLFTFPLWRPPFHIPNNVILSVLLLHDVRKCQEGWESRRMLERSSVVRFQWTGEGIISIPLLPVCLENSVCVLVELL